MKQYMNQIANLEMETNRIGWNADHGFTLDEEPMTFRRLPKDRKRIVADIFNAGLSRYDNDYEEIVALADYHGLPLGDILACINYANGVVEKLNLYVDY